MNMTVEEFRQGFRDHTLAFCMPAAHAEFSSEFLDEFSARILRRDWRDVLVSHSRSPSLLVGNESEDEIVTDIYAVYGVDVSDLPGLPMWELMRRCADTATDPAHTTARMTTADRFIAICLGTPGSSSAMPIP